jgi:hypothetical protein
MKVVFIDNKPFTSSKFGGKGFIQVKIIYLIID